MSETDWRLDGVRIVKSSELDPNTAKTPGMDRAAAINFAKAGAKQLWAGTVSIHPDAKTGAHHHGHLESVIYVVRGRARMRWGDKLQFNGHSFAIVDPAPTDWEQHNSGNGIVTAADLNRFIVFR